MIKALLFAVAVLLLATLGVSAAEGPIRFGLTGAVVRKNLDFYDRWAAYLSRKIGRPVQFAQPRTYREAIDLIETGQHDFSWICSFPYAKYRNSNFFSLLAVPVFEGKPLYQSYIITHKYASFGTIGDLKNHVFAYADPDSNTGYIVPRRMIDDLGQNPDKFFRHTFFTYSHAETIEAVAEHVADGAAVDSYIWEYLHRREPSLTRKTKIIQRSETFGFPPLVYRLGVDEKLRARMTEALLTMDQDAEGRSLLADMMLDRFISATPSLYDSVKLKLDRR